MDKLLFPHAFVDKSCETSYVKTRFDIARDVAKVMRVGVAGCGACWV